MNHEQRTAAPITAELDDVAGNGPRCKAKDDVQVGKLRRGDERSAGRQGMRCRNFGNFHHRRQQVAELEPPSAQLAGCHIAAFRIIGC